AVKLASQEAEKRLIISKLRDMHNIDSLRLITLFMDDKSLQNEAHDAIINVLTRSRRDRGKYTNEKIAIVQKVIDTSEDKRNVNRAKTELEELQKK
ncbi:MAG: hypothetical protein MI741_17655, partial [Rhodospirillales bacterium]|nr:hypothetical protein [Rhodospirillales bacterium]